MTSSRKHEREPSALSRHQLDDSHWYYKVYAGAVEGLHQYHQARFLGEPHHGCCIYVTHHGAGYFNLDLILAGYNLAWRNWFLSGGERVALRTVAARSNIERFLPGLPKIKEHFGLIDPGEASCLQVLERGEQLLLTPGGSREAQPGPEFYTLKWQDRFGFVRLALKTGAPIVPLAVMGGKQAYPGVKWKKLSFWAPVPLPARMDIAVGEPIPVQKQPDQATDPAVVGPIHRLAWERTQALFDRLLTERKGWRG
jgi:1-acyl-sn-glycerol-3-phosphate acyltransferase